MKKSLKKNALLNMTKQVMQILFPLVTVPYITRVLLPENYGKVNFGNSIISYIALIASLGISSYAIREGSLIKDNRKNFNCICNQIFSINVFSTFLAYLILCCLLLFVPRFKDYRILLIIQSISVIFTTIGVDWVNSIEEDFLYLTIRYIVLHIIALILTFAFVKEPDDYYIYAVICLITSAGGNLLNIFYIRKYVRIRFTFEIDWKRHLFPILVLFGNSIAMSIYVNSDITMLGLFCGDREVGIYGVVTKVYSIIKQMLNAILVVSIPRLTQTIGSGDQTKFRELGEKILNALITMMVPLIVGIIVFRREAVTLAGGKEYLSGSNSLMILSFAVALSLFATFYSACVLMPLKKEKGILVGTIITAIVNVALNFVLIPLLGMDGAAITTLLSETIVSIYFGYLVQKEKYHFFNIRILFLSLIGGITVVIISIIVKSLSNTFVVYFPLSVVLSVLAYGAIQIIGKNQVFIDLLSLKKS